MSLEEQIKAVRRENVTPGEWKACTYDPMHPCHVFVEIGGKCHPIHQDLPNTAADAHLMAAAKDMYRALTWAMTKLDAFGQSEHFKERHADAMRALKKAEGA